MDVVVSFVVLIVDLKAGVIPAGSAVYAVRVVPDEWVVAEERVVSG